MFLGKRSGSNAKEKDKDGGEKEWQTERRAAEREDGENSAQ